MFTRLTNFTLTPAPSALIVIDGTNGATFSHCVPEDGYIECMRTNTTTIHEGGAIGKAREQIGTIRLAEDQSGLPSIVLKDLEVKVRKLWSDTFGRESPLNTPPQKGKVIHPCRHSRRGASCRLCFAASNAGGHPRDRMQRHGQRQNALRLHRVCQAFQTWNNLRATFENYLLNMRYHLLRACAS